MLIKTLKIEGLRCLRGLDLEMGPGLHVFVGPNGSGKTSILEAVSLLGSGRSFRSSANDVLITRGQSVLNVFAEVQRGSQVRRLGFSRVDKQWRARIDGIDVKKLSELVRLLPVWVMEPNSHVLIDGGSEQRRALVDWMLFHVEPSFARVSGQYRHALKQRNAALKRETVTEELLAWDQVLLDHGLALSGLRAKYLPEWLDRATRYCAQLLPDLPVASLEFRSGFPTDQDPQTYLQERHGRDLALGYTSVGPHRADWTLKFGEVAARDFLSRGQTKNSCLAMVLATLSMHRQHSGDSPVLCLDDLFSELDIAHQERCLRHAAEVAEQVLVTGVSSSKSVSAWSGAFRLHHIEDIVAAH